LKVGAAALLMIPASSARVNALAKLAENDWKLTGEMHAQEFPCLLDRIRLTKASFPV